MKKMLTCLFLILFCCPCVCLSGVSLSGSTNQMENCSIDNQAVVMKGTSNVVYNTTMYMSYLFVDTSCEIKNSISVLVGDSDIYIDTGATVTGNYNAFTDSAKAGAGTYTDGGHTLWSTDPLFVNAAGGDFHLMAGSPCIGSADDGGDIGVYPFAGHGLGIMNMILNLFL